MQISPVTANYKQQSTNRQSFGNVRYSKVLKDNPLTKKVLDKILETPAVQKFIGVDQEELRFFPGLTKGEIKGKLWLEGRASEEGCAVPTVYQFYVTEKTTKQQIQDQVELGYKYCKAKPFIWEAGYDAGLLKRATVAIKKFFNTYNPSD